MQILEHEPLNADEQPSLQKIEQVLTDDLPVSLLIGPEREIIELPRSVFQVLKQVVYHMGHGRTIFVVPEEQTLTTQEAADILDVSRPYIVKLLDQGKIPFTKVGTHRRIRVSDLMKYNQQMEAEQEKALDELTRMSQELGLYD